MPFKRGSTEAGVQVQLHHGFAFCSGDILDSVHKDIHIAKVRVVTDIDYMTLTCDVVILEIWVEKSHFIRFP